MIFFMKNKNLIILFILIIVWSLFFAVYKYFMWGVFKTETITLQYISWYLSIGTIWAFVIWGLVYELFREKKYHLGTMIFTILSILGIYFLAPIKLFSDSLLVGGVTLVIWFFYWLWWVLKNILISTQIKESSLWDTKINGLANIFFITSIIIWSIFGWKIAEKLGIYWIFIIVLLLIIGLIGGIFLSYKNQEESKSIKQKALDYKSNYINDFKFIIKKYSLIMIFTSFIIAIATILSQKAIEYNVEVLWKSGSESAVILIYSAVGSIVWNIISMKIKTARWDKFFIFSLLFALTCFLFPSFISNFLSLSILAFIAWMFFWIIYNLLESYFFKKIADDEKKSYGSATLWVIMSSIIAFLMFLVDVVEKATSFAWVYYFMGTIILFVWIIIFRLKNKLN